MLVGRPDADLAAVSEESASQAQVRPIGDAGTIPFSLWGPFAGRGTRGRHATWLLNDKGAQAEELRDTVIERFARRMIPDARVDTATLVRQGVLVDARPFFLVRRKRSTVGLYLARFGEDLYISQVTYSKNPISVWRVVLLVLLVLFVAAYTIAYASSLEAAGGILRLVSDGSPLVTMTCCIGPFYILGALALGFLAVFSLYKWLTEKDLPAALRMPANEFDIDDSACLEKAVEQTVREALDSLGLESRVLMPPAFERPMIRII
jgi:hypothetical protein